MMLNQQPTQYVQESVEDIQKACEKIAQKHGYQFTERSPAEVSIKTKGFEATVVITEEDEGRGVVIRQISPDAFDPGARFHAQQVIDTLEEELMKTLTPRF